MKINTGRGTIPLITLIGIWSISALTSLPGLAVSPILGQLSTTFPDASELDIQMLSSLPSLLIIPFILLAGKLAEKRDFVRLLRAGLWMFAASGVLYLFSTKMWQLIAVSALLGCLSVLRGEMRIGDVQAMLQYTKQFSQPFTSIAGMAGSFSAASAAAGRIFALLDASEETPDPVPGLMPQVSTGAVEFRHVSFGYSPEHQLMHDVNITVKSGQKVAIVGPTGAGKTTLINLLMRFYDVNGGSIEVAGNDIRSLTRASLRGSYGMVLQETWLRAGTVRENIAYGKPDATEEEIVAAAKAAHADSFIRRLPKGYDTVIAEDGGNISQGQKQLLCIARVMLCLPPMLILDEATSSIDTRTEVRIQAAFARMMQGRTSFIVAHRLSTIREADVILVMKDGHIVEQGDHDTLLEQGGFYAKLYNSQFEGVET